MFGIGQTELVLIILFAFLLFGPDKLPQMGRTIGRALRQFRETQEKMTAVVQTEIVDPMAQAAQAPGAPAKAAADDADADREDGTAAAPARKETFAERRARLAAEKAAAEQGAEGAAAEAADAAPAAAEAGAQGEKNAAPAAAAPAAPAAAEPELAEKPLTTADLYARRPKKKAAEAPAATPAADAPAASADTPKQGEGEAE